MPPSVRAMENGIARMVMDVVGSRFDVDGDTLTRSTRLVEDLQADSLAILELALALEEAFDIDVASDQVARLGTVGDAIEVVARAIPLSLRAPADPVGAYYSSTGSLTTRTEQEA